jgi:pyruvate dehydrogenase E1 component alpha subunit
VFTVREITKFSKKYAIENGPICLEMLTYRYHGHSMSDPGISYRTREEIMERRKLLDPINIVSELITSNNVATEKDLKDIQKEINSEIEEAIIKAKAAPEPGKEELITDVFAEDGYYIRGPNFEDSVFPDSKF